VTGLALEIRRAKALLLQHATSQTVAGSGAQFVIPLDGVQARHRRDERRVVHHDAAGRPRARRDRAAQNAMPHYHPDVHGARTLDRMFSLVKQK
jgi:hypothetical protein